MTIGTKSCTTPLERKPVLNTLVMMPSDTKKFGDNREARTAEFHRLFPVETARQNSRIAYQTYDRLTSDQARAEFGDYLENECNLTLEDVGANLTLAIRKARERVGSRTSS